MTLGGIFIEHFLARRDRDAKQETTDAQLADIHVLVNSRLTEALDEIKDLKRALVLERATTPPTRTAS